MIIVFAAAPFLPWQTDANANVNKPTTFWKRPRCSQPCTIAALREASYATHRQNSARSQAKIFYASILIVQTGPPQNTIIHNNGRLFRCWRTMSKESSEPSRKLVLVWAWRVDRFRLCCPARVTRSVCKAKRLYYASTLRLVWESHFRAHVTVAILAAYKTIFHLQRIWIVKDSAPIVRFLTHQVLRSRSYRRYYRDVQKNVQVQCTRYLRSSWILVINGLKFRSWNSPHFFDRDDLGILP